MHLVKTLAFGAQFAGLYATALLVLLWVCHSGVGKQIGALWATPFYSAAALWASSAVCAFSFMHLCNIAWATAGTFVARALGWLWILCWVVGTLWARGWSSLMGNYGWMAVLSLFAHLSFLAASHRKRLVELAQSGDRDFVDYVRPHMLGAQGLWDQARLTIGTLVWKILILPIQGFFNMALPREMRVYACEIPIFDLGEGVELGVAAHISSQKKGKKAKVPEYFVCNVGQIAIDSTSRGLADTQRTMNTLRDVWEEFSGPNVDGLMSNVVMVFPKVESQLLLKEVNLSVWETQKQAYEWYATSPGHRDVLQQHVSGGLMTFGNLLTSLEPACSLRYMDRCQTCARVVESMTVGEPPPLYCQVCGGDTFKYPLF